MKRTGIGLVNDVRFCHFDDRVVIISSKKSFGNFFQKIWESSHGAKLGVKM